MTPIEATEPIADISHSAGSRAALLVASLAPERRLAAGVILERLLSWTRRRSGLLALNLAEVQQPSVRFDTLTGDVFWLARATEGGDAKIEILTRTITSLDSKVRDQLAVLLDGLVPGDAWSGKRVALIPFAQLADQSSFDSFLGALDFALGAVYGSDRPQV